MKFKILLSFLLLTSLALACDTTEIEPDLMQIQAEFQESEIIDGEQVLIFHPTNTNTVLGGEIKISGAEFKVFYDGAMQPGFLFQLEFELTRTTTTLLSVKFKAGEIQ